MTFEIRQGHVLEVLRAMPDESVQCCITSPPYYGLRSYGTEPIVWGNHNGCSHEWGEALKYAKQDNRTLEEKIAQGANVGSNQNFNSANTTATSGNFCLFCNAWRGELGLEPTFQLYISHLIEIFAEVKRVLKKDGTCWVNLGDSYAGSPVGIFNGGSDKIKSKAGDAHKGQTAASTVRIDKSRMGVPAKSLMNIPARFAIAMTDELKFIQRNEIVWHKPACMPSSAKDRFTVDFEPIFFFSKNPKYKFNQQLEPAVGDDTERERPNGQPTFYGGIGVNTSCGSNGETRNKRTVWRVNFEPQSSEHYASYPTKLVEPMILAGTDGGDTVMDIFVGTGTTLLTALRHRRKALGIELQPKYIEIASRRLREVQVNLF